MDFSIPRSLTEEEIPAVINQFRIAARNALEAGKFGSLFQLQFTHDLYPCLRRVSNAASVHAGFDGVELHAANGYLLDQFMKDGVNDRADGYGGSLENRCRLALEVVDALTDQIGPYSVGVRLSPYSGCLGCRDSDPDELAVYMARELNRRDVLYLNVVEPEMASEDDGGALGVGVVSHRLQAMRDTFDGTLMVGGGYGREEGNCAIAEEYADLVAYGRLFLANPDLPERFRRNAPLNKYDRATFYTDDPVVGYTDYPFLEDGGEVPMDEGNGVI